MSVLSILGFHFRYLIGIYQQKGLTSFGNHFSAFHKTSTRPRRLLNRSTRHSISEFPPQKSSQHLRTKFGHSKVHDKAFILLQPQTVFDFHPPNFAKLEIHRRAMATSSRSMTVMICLLVLIISPHLVTAQLVQALCANYNTGLDFADGKDLATLMQGSLTVAESCDHSDKRLPIQW